MRPVTIGRWHDIHEGAVRFDITVAPLEDGFALTRPAITLLTERQLFPDRADQSRRRRRATRDPEQILRRVDLQQGEPLRVAGPDEPAGGRITTYADAVRGLNQEWRA